MSGTIDTLTVARKLQAADLSGKLEDIRRRLDVVLWMSVANLAMTSVILGIVLARFFQP